MASTRNSEPPEALPGAVAACLRRHLQQPRQRIVLAFSGGRDSVALLHVLQGLQREFDFELAAAHVNHRLSAHADRWQSFCADFCARAGLPLQTFQVEVPRNSAEGLEAAARRQRYAALARSGADWLAVAHHREDQAETLLFNLLRGAGVRGAAGMAETRALTSHMRMIRPLLLVSRVDIARYLAQHGLAWVDDDSNDDHSYARNFLRHEALPLLAARFPATTEKLAAAAMRLAEAAALVDELARLDLAGQAPHFPLPTSCLLGLPEPRARNVLRFVLAEQGVGIASERRLCEFVRQLADAGPDRHPTVVFGRWKLFRQGRALHLTSA